MNNVYDTERTHQNNTSPAGSFGYLKISVAAARRALPVEGARISVFSTAEERNDDLLAVLTSDESGVTGTISLPAPLAESSLNPGLPNPYNIFYVRISALNFVTRDKLPVQIFPGVTSDLIINMQPAGQ